MARATGNKGRGPGLLYILAALVIIGVASAKFFGFSPTQIGDGRKEPPMENDGQRPSPAPSEASEFGKILVYHSHTTENYKGKSPHDNRGPGDIIQVGKALVDALRAEGVDAVHVMTVHDLPDWNDSIDKARMSLENALDRHDDVKAIIDVHRDAIPAEETPGYATLTVGEDSFARILFIVGTSNNPHSEQNINYAQALRDRLEEALPGVTRGVRLMRQDTNGQFHPHSATVFIGDYEDNDVDQARASARVLGGIIAESLRNDR